jgi:hypothetical protein
MIHLTRADLRQEEDEEEERELRPGVGMFPTELWDEDDLDDEDLFADDEREESNEFRQGATGLTGLRVRW